MRYVYFIISLLSIRICMVAASLLGDSCGVRIKPRVALAHPISRLYTVSLAPLRIVTEFVAVSCLRVFNGE